MPKLPGWADPASNTDPEQNPPAEDPRIRDAWDAQADKSGRERDWDH
jgi:hypothetical protein